MRVGGAARARRVRLVDAPRRRRALRPRRRPGRRWRSRHSPARRRAGFVDIAAPFATGLHQVDNPVFDRDGNLYVTYSGTRGQQVPVSIFRVRPNGTRETFSSGIVNPTSMAIDPTGQLLRVEPVRGHGLPGDAGRVDRSLRARSRRRLRPRVRARRHAVCRRSIGHDLPRRPFGACDDVRDAAGERGGVPSGDRAGRRALRHRPDAVVLRSALSHRA